MSARLPSKNVPKYDAVKSKPVFAFKKTLMAIAVSSGIVLGAGSLTGCSTTQTQFDEVVETEFLTDYSLLQSAPGQPGKSYYEKEGVDWSQYHSVMIEDVTINDVSVDDGNKMSRRDRLMMGIYFQNSMRMSVQKKYVVTNRAEPGVLIIRAAISDATAGSSLAAINFIGDDDKYGQVVIEGEIVDAMSGEPLIAIIDRQSGGFLQAYGDWDDAAIAFDEWSDQLYSVLQSHMETRPAGNRAVIAKSSRPKAASKTYNIVTTSRPHIDVNKQINSAASQYEQQQYSQIIDELLIAAAGDLKADRLISPPGRNAMERYNQVLNMDPMNAHAKDGLNIIASRYLSWAETALTNGEVERSRMYLERARHISSSSESIQQSIAQLDDKLNQPAPEVLAFNKTLASQPTAMGVAEPVQAPAPAPVAQAPVAPAPVAQAPVAAPEPVVKAAPKTTTATVAKAAPKPTAAPAPVKAATVVAAAPQPQPTDVMVEETAKDVPNLSKVEEVAVAPAPEPVKKVEEYDPWKGANMGNAQLDGSKLRPFVLGLTTTGDMAKIVTATKKRLTDAGFEVVGEYSPYNKATIIIVTNNTLKSQAAKSEFGGYGAAVRVSVTQASGKVQIAYTNPYYTHNIYRMNGNMSSVANDLAKTLGKQKVYGSNTGIAAGDLRDWHYMFGMPYFDDHITVSKGSSYASLVKTIDKNLTSGKSGASKVYRIDIPGKNETVFGVGIAKGDGADRTVMGNIDVAGVKHSAHLPYEILVSDKKAYMLNGKFRIALSFPDLTMGQFMAISGAPDATETTMKSISSPGSQLSSN